MSNFTPWVSLVGGVLIGASASMLLALNGRIAGISGIVGGVLKPNPGDTAWRVWFISGLIAGGAVLAALRPASFGAAIVSVPWAIVAGLLVGFGTRLGSGCTSGHGVCGISRFATRSLAATATFMASGAAAAFIVHHVIGVSR